MRRWDNRRKYRDDESLGMVLIGAAAIAFLVPRLPGLRVECARPIAIALLGGNPGREVAVECLGGSDSDGVCLVRSRRNDAFFCDLEALVPSHPIGCIVEKRGLCCIAST